MSEYDVLSPTALALYEGLIAATSLKAGRETAYADDPAVRELLEKGFAEFTDDKELVAVPPVDAFERVLTNLQKEFLAQQRELLDAYTYLDDLQERFLQSQPASDADELADIRTEPGAFRAALCELVATATAELLSWNLVLADESAAEAAAASTAGKSTESTSPHSLRQRAAYDSQFLHAKPGSGFLRSARAAGHELRIADELPSRMLIVDDTSVLLPLSPDDDAGALVIRSPLVVNAMREFFELMWQRSMPWVDREADGELLTPIQRQIIALLAVGHSDEDIAGHLDISLRTVRRHIADVMTRLGASTRFAAGIAAAQAGLLDDV